MAEAAKVIRIELRVGGGDIQDKKPRQAPKSSTILGRTELQSKRLFNKIAGAGVVATATQLVSKGFSIAETLSYNSSEKTSMMELSIAKKALSNSIITGGYLLGGPVGVSVGMAINKFLIDPLYTFGGISIKRNLDETRATNRFYMSDFVQKGNKVFDYASQSYVNEDINKTQISKIWKRSYR